MTKTLRITGKNSDGEYWLHLEGSRQKAGLNLGDPAGMIASAMIMAASGHTYIRTDAPELVALVRAAKALRDGMHLAILVKNPNGIRLRAEFDAALQAWEKMK